MKFLKILLFPVSIIYGAITFVRNKLFDFEILKSTTFEIPIISVGNIKVGGTGKTPHIEYLVRLLSNKKNIAILSRGYGRNTKGYILANNNSTSQQIGDEPKQYMSKFNKFVEVAVCEKRVDGVKKLLNDKPDTNLILLDDAYQHRYIKPKFSILIKEFSSLGKSNYMLPTGNNREYENGIKRADIVIISKSPKVYSPIEKRNALDHLKLDSHQKAYFSYIKYGDPIALNRIHKPITFKAENEYSKKKTALLITGIGNPLPLIEYLEEQNTNIKHLNFKDHHQYSVADILKIQKIFDSIVTEKFLITTEKDAIRLQEPNILEVTKQLPIYYVPIEVEFHEQEKEQFNKQIIDICQN